MNARVHEAPQAPSTNLTVIERAALALGAAEHETKLRELAARHADITAITNEAGRDDCHSALMELRSTRVAIEKTGKDAREDAQKFAKAVIAEEKRLVEIIAPEEERLRKLRDDWDAAREQERLAEAEAERIRVEGHMARIATLRGIPATMVGKTAAELAAKVALTAGRPLALAAE